MAVVRSGSAARGEDAAGVVRGFSRSAALLIDQL